MPGERVSQAAPWPREFERLEGEPSRAPSPQSCSGCPVFAVDVANKVCGTLVVLKFGKEGSGKGENLSLSGRGCLRQLRPPMLGSACWMPSPAISLCSPRGQIAAIRRARQPPCGLAQRRGSAAAEAARSVRRNIFPASSTGRAISYQPIIISSHV